MESPPKRNGTEGQVDMSVLRQLLGVPKDAPGSGPRQAGRSRGGQVKRGLVRKNRRSRSSDPWWLTWPKGMGVPLLHRWTVDLGTGTLWRGEAGRERHAGSTFSATFEKSWPQVTGQLDADPWTTGPRRLVALANFTARRGEGDSEIRKRMHKIVIAEHRLWCSYSTARRKKASQSCFHGQAPSQRPLPSAS